MSITKDQKIILRVKIEIERAYVNTNIRFIAVLSFLSSSLMRQMQPQMLHHVSSLMLFLNSSGTTWFVCAFICDSSSLLSLAFLLYLAQSWNPIFCVTCYITSFLSLVFEKSMQLITPPVSSLRLFFSSRGTTGFGICNIDHIKDKNKRQKRTNKKKSKF